MRITAAAIVQDGQMFTGRRHHEIISMIVRHMGIRPVTGKQGFVTNEGRFVDRKEAARIALEAGQVKELKSGSGELFSEDLW